jgi:hypothetical protein
MPRPTHIVRHVERAHATGGLGGVRHNWQIAHAARTIAAVLVFGCLGAAAMATPSTTTKEQQGKP